MFDIGFSEMVVIAVVALVVIGPERLPKAARTAGHLFGRLQRYVNDVKADINREMELDELRKMQQDVQAAARDFETSVHTAARGVESEVRSVETQLNSLAAADQAVASPAASTADGTPAVPDAAVAPDAPGAPGVIPGAAADGSAERSRQAALPGLEQP